MRIRSRALDALFSPPDECERLEWNKTLDELDEARAELIELRERNAHQAENIIALKKLLG